MQIGVETSRAVDGKRLFIVNDDEIVRAVLQFMLGDDNEAHDLPDLDAAFAKAEAWPPDLLLFGFAAVARDDSVLATIAARLPTARILLVTDAGDDDAARGWIGRGAHGVLSKPLTVETVRRRVDSVLGLLKAPMVQLGMLAS